MGYNNRKDDPVPTTLQKIKLWALVVSVVVLLGWSYGNSIDQWAFKHCAGDYKTPQCEKDRAKEKERAYERAKSNQ